ncbi:MAG: sigma-70 family RNA polymerase sigma factor [Clostridia bacterium]|nr:sigma-70 family RNA polymerase sigma factor [Clostridia bacterium]
MVDQLNLKQFNSIYEKTYNQVLKYIVCKCSNMEDVNDIIQETYIEVYNAIVKKKKIEDFEKYIIGIAKNKVNKYYTLLYRLQNISIFTNKNDEIELLDNIKSDIDVEQIIIKADDIEKIWDYLKTKKIIIQKVFYLYYELDLTIKEIANELNIGESYTKNCLYRTLKELQEFLGKDCD